MKFTDYNHAEIELEILKYWQKHKIVEKLRKKNEKGKKFNFLDGPPYTSGKFHLAHAWNYALKDIVLRYKRMHGLNVWDRNGFDVHGLPTEHKVMAKHNLKTKEDIEKFGVAKFVTECEKFSLEMADVMTKDLTRMGVTFDSSNPYMALKTEYIEGEWDLIKKAHEKNKLYYGEKVLTWCQHCETAVAKHECEYQNATDNSIFVKFPVKSKKINKGKEEGKEKNKKEEEEKEFLIIWTTTPWTIPFNLAIMAGPEIDYVKVEVEGEKWILAKALAGMVVQAVANKKMKVLEEFKGTELEGLEYTHPFENKLSKYAELKKDHPNIHTVILSEKYVDTTAGSGLVHAAPGCGPEDQEACKPYNIPPFNALQEDGFFPKEMGEFKGLRAKVDDDKFITALEKEGVLIATTEVEHEYPYCWRCHQPIVFRITYQWFLKVEDIKEKILQDNKKVQWVPDTALNAYEAWVANLRDNSVSRQRYWGTPLPIWKCQDCEEIKVISSREEIKKNGGKIPENLHLPWIDSVELNCKCGKKMHRVPDVIDVWVDAGTASWNCLDNDPEKMKDWFPADFILEAKEQTRLWFSLLSICSHIYLNQNAFKAVYVYGMLNDIEGKKMSKSLGNIISPYELIDKHGVDVLRYYMCQNNAGQDINFSWEECTVKARQLMILWNIHKLLINLAKENEINPFQIKESTISNSLGAEDKFIISKLHSAIKTATELMESYRIDEVIEPLEELFLELSRTYIQMTRDKSTIGSEKEKKAVMYTISTVILESLKMFNIFTPFISEAIYLNLREEFDLKEESISHYSWPNFDSKKIDLKLEEEIAVAEKIIQASLNAREKAKRGLRWPIKELSVVSSDKSVKKAVKDLQEILRNQTNAKEVKVIEQMEGLKTTIKPIHAKLGPVFGKDSREIIAQLTEEDGDKVLSELKEKGKYSLSAGGKKFELKEDMIIIEQEVSGSFCGAEFKGGAVYLNTELNDDLEAEGYAREVMRQVQNSRKEAGLEKLDRINLFIKTNLSGWLKKFEKEISEKVGAEKLEISQEEPAKKYKETSEFKVKNENFSIWFDKV